MLGITEVIIILVVFGLLFFGDKKIGGLGKALGRFTGEYKKGKMEVEEELKSMKQEIGSIDEEDKENQ